MFTVKDKNGKELKTYKALAPAKKMADAEEGTVFEDGVQVYPEITMQETAPDHGQDGYQDEEITREAVQEETEQATEPKQPAETQLSTQVKHAAETQPWRVKVRINIRKEPSLKAEKVGAADVGAVLDAYEDLGDWLRIRWKGSEAYARHKNYEYIGKAE